MATEATTNPAETYTLYGTGYTLFLEKIEKLNKRADKISVPRIVVNEITKGIKEVYDEDLKETIPREYVEFTVHGEVPKINGWQFIATVEPDDSGKNLLRKAPGVGIEIPHEYREVQMGRCDHCNTHRRRNETFVLHNMETGQWKVVGRSCIRDFLGLYTSPDAMIRWLQNIMDIGNMVSECDEHTGGCGGSRVDYVKIDEFLYRCAVIANRKGFTTRKKSDEMEAMHGTYVEPTANESWNTFFITRYCSKPAEAQANPYYGVFLYTNGKKPSNYGTSSAYRPIAPETTEEHIKACELLNAAMTYIYETIISKDDSDLNDFEYNLKVISQKNFIDGRQKGIASSVFPIWFRHVAMLKEQENATRSNFVGKVGERSRHTLTLVDVRGYTNNFGDGKVYKFKDNAGNDYTWFTKDIGLEAGKTYEITATIKSHNVYKGYKSTIITRGKVAKT